MNVWEIAGVSLTAAALTMFLRQINPAAALTVSLSAAVLLLLWALRFSLPVVSAARELIRRASLSDTDAAVLWKAAAIALVTELTADVCRDAGESAVANRAQLCGRILIAVQCLPAIEEVLAFADEVFSGL